MRTKRNQLVVLAVAVLGLIASVAYAYPTIAVFHALKMYGSAAVIRFYHTAPTIQMADNDATALTFESNDGTDLLVFDTTDGVEKLTFTGAVGTFSTVTGANGETLSNGTDGTWTLARNTNAALTVQCADSSGAADCTFDTTGAGAITIGSDDVTNVTVNSDVGLTLANSESVNTGTDATFDFTRNTAGIVTLTCSDDDAVAGCTYDAGGASPIVIGSADVTNVTIDSDVGVTLASSESVNTNTDATFDFTRNDAGVVTFTCSDDDATAGCVYDAGGASPIQIGSADVTTVTVVSTASDAGFAVPAGSIGTAELVADTLDFDRFEDALDLDAATSITGTAAEVLSVARTLTDATTESGVTVTVTPSDTSAGTTAQYGLELTNAASTEALDGLLVLNSADTDDATGAAILVNNPTRFTNILSTTNATLSSAGVLTLANADNVSSTAAGTWTLDRSASGTVTITATDDDANAALTVAAGGTGITTLGAATNADVRILSDGVGTAELQLVAGAIDGTEILDDTVALTTDTSGDYVGSLATTAVTSGLTGGAAGSEGAVLSLGLDYSATLAGNPALGANQCVFAATGLLCEGATANENELIVVSPDVGADATITLPTLTGTLVASGDTGTVTGTMILNDTVALTTDTVGSYVANAATSALTGLTGGSAGSEGASLSLAWDYTATSAADPALAANVCVAGVNGFICEGATANANELWLSFADCGADAQVNVPCSAGDLVSTGDTGTVTSTMILNDTVALTTDTTGSYVASVATTATTSGLTGGAAGSEGATLSLGLDYSATLGADPALAASQCVFAATGLLCEGATANGFETLVIAADPGADVTLTLPATTGTLVGSGDTDTVTATMLDNTATIGADPAWGASQVGFGTTGIIFEGATADANEGLLTSPDVGADTTWVLPTAAGDLVGTGDTGTVTGTMVSNNSINIPDDTVGNYVLSVATTATTSGLTGGAAASEGGALSLALDYTATIGADPALNADQCVFSTTGLVCESTAADANELLITAAACGADATVNVPCETGTIITTAASGTVTATMIANPVRSVSFPLRTFYDCQTDAGADIGYGETADGLPDFINSATDGVGLVLRFDDAGGQEDEGAESCNDFVVPADYASGGTLKVVALKDAETGANAETITCAGSINGGMLGATGTVDIDQSAVDVYSCLPTLLGLAAGNAVHFYLSIESAGTMDDQVDFLGVEFQYNAAQ